jgi:hypothetical protein
MKLTREQIREGLKQVPIETVLLGSQTAKEHRLTKKQKAFAEALALGETKAGAYRKAYNTKGKTKTVGRSSQELAKHPGVTAYVERLEQAQEVVRLSTPARLRALVISELAQHVISEENTAKEKLTALKLLGSVTEVAAFTERREVLQVSASVEIRQELIKSLEQAIKAHGVADRTVTDVDSLLAELSAAKTIEAEPAQLVEAELESGPGASETVNLEHPPGGHPPSTDKISTQPLLSNPHNGSQPIPIQESASTSPTKGQSSDETCADVSL